jgi:hypothetical protein
MMTINAAASPPVPAATRFPSTQPPRWRVLSMLRAIKWAREARIPYTAYVADKAL